LATGLVIAIPVCLLAVAAICLFAFLPVASPKGSQANWTHQELVAYLNTLKGGESVRMVPTTWPVHDVPIDAVWLIWESLANDPIGKIARLEATGDTAEVFQNRSCIVHCVRHPTEASARETFRNIQRDLQKEHLDPAKTRDQGFAWGRFTFGGDPVFLFWLRAALNVPQH